MFNQKFEIGEFVVVKDLDVSGVVVALENTKTLNGDKELRYRVMVPGTSPMLLKEDQLDKSEIEKKYNGYGYLDTEVDYDVSTPAFDAFDILDVVDDMGFEVPPLEDETEVLKMKEKPFDDEIELVLLDSLIEGSLQRKNKEEFMEHTNAKKKLLKKMQRKWK